MTAEKLVREKHQTEGESARFQQFIRDSSTRLTKRFGLLAKLLLLAPGLLV